jgi:seryl-tRNA synthetase
MGRSIGWILAGEGALIATFGALWLHDRTVAQQEARQLKQLQGQLTTTQQQLSQAQATGKQEASQIASLQGQLQQAQSQAQQEAQQITGLQGQIQTLQAQLQQAQTQVNTLQAQWQQAQAQLSQAQATIGTDTRQIAQLQGQVQSLQNQLAQAQQQAQQAQQELQQFLQSVPPTIQATVTPSNPTGPRNGWATVTITAQLVYQGTTFPYQPAPGALKSWVLCSGVGPCSVTLTSQPRMVWTVSYPVGTWGYQYQATILAGIIVNGQNPEVTLTIPVTPSG